MLHVGTAVRWQDTWLCCRYKLKIMFYFLKCKCLWFVYLYVVVIDAGLGVSALLRYGKQWCPCKISRGSGSMRDAICTTVWFGYTRQVHKPSRCAGFNERCHGPIWRAPWGTSIWVGQPLLRMAQIRGSHGEISDRAGTSSVWEDSDHPDTSHWECTSCD